MAVADLDTLRGLAVALGLGLLVGMERERRVDAGQGIAGVRTFALIALAGALAERIGGVGIAVEVFVVGVGEAGRQLGTAGGEGVGDVFDEDEAEHQVLVFGGVHVGAQLVGGGPEGFFDVVEH